MAEPPEDAWVRSSFCESAVLLGSLPGGVGNIHFCRESAREQVLQFSRPVVSEFFAQVKRGTFSGFTGELCVELLGNGMYGLFRRGTPGKAIQFLKVELEKFYEGVVKGEFDDI